MPHWQRGKYDRKAALHAISAVLAGRPVAEKSLALIAKALSRAPVLEVVDSLIMLDRLDMPSTDHMAGPPLANERCLTCKIDHL